MLRTGKWKITSGTVNLRLPSGKDTTLNLLYFIHACHRDDFLRFDSTDHGAVLNGGTSCSTADADSINFLWRLSNSDKTLDIYNGFNLIDSVAEIVYFDTAWEVRFDTANSPAINIRNAELSSFTQASFNMDYYLVAQYPDTTYGHQATPIYKPDTFRYHITYTNY
jgi:hypothetical protein